MLPTLTIRRLRKEAGVFARNESKHSEPSLYGVDNGKKVGTYLEHKFQKHLQARYQYVRGSSAEGIDFLELKVDIKVTSTKQLQSSCPFKMTYSRSSRSECFRWRTLRHENSQMNC